jgi:hypothetical protein
MTLKEKFTKILYTQSHDDTYCLRIRFENIDEVIDSQEKRADEYAIEFAEWCNSEEAEDLILDLILVGELDKKPTTKQLLEQFKKEKGL